MTPETKSTADVIFDADAPAGQRFTAGLDSIASVFPAISGKEFDAAKARAMRHLFGSPIDLVDVAAQACGMKKGKGEK